MRFHSRCTVKCTRFAILYLRIILRNYFGSFMPHLNNRCSLVSFRPSCRESLRSIDLFTARWVLATLNCHSYTVAAIGPPFPRNIHFTFLTALDHEFNFRKLRLRIHCLNSFAMYVYVLPFLFFITAVTHIFMLKLNCKLWHLNTVTCVWFQAFLRIFWPVLIVSFSVHLSLCVALTLIRVARTHSYRTYVMAHINLILCNARERKVHS